MPSASDKPDSMPDLPRLELVCFGLPTARVASGGTECPPTGRCSGGRTLRRNFRPLCLDAGGRRTPAAAQASKDRAADVQVEMRHVDYRVDSTIVLQIAYLRRGQANDRSSAVLRRKTSFTLGIDSAIIAISPAGLRDLLNRYVFSYPGSPLKHLSLSVEQGQLKQQGRLHGISFTVLGDLTVTPEGDLRLHPTSIKSAGIKVGGLMKLFGLNLEKLVKLRGAPPGVQIQETTSSFTRDAAAPAAGAGKGEAGGGSGQRGS